jgi:hypothetical protein
MSFVATVRRALRSGARAAALLALIACAGLPTPAAADDIVFVVRNDHPYAVALEFHSQDRSYAWPGGDRTYYLDDDETQQIWLTCRSGETICYAAWVYGDEDTVWGVGPNNDLKCRSCCYECAGGETEEIVLVP